MFKSEGQKIVMGVLVFILLVAILSVTFTREYTRPAYVDNVRGEVVRLVDARGHIWEWEKEENESFNLGEKVNLRFDNNGTDEEVTDDIIIRIEKIENK